MVEGIGDGLQVFSGQVQIDGRIPDVGVSEQYLNGAQVRAGFEQVSRETVPQGVRVNAFGDAGALGRYAAGMPDNPPGNT